jgi:glutamate dehydrogenase (NADP+)
MDAFLEYVLARDPNQPEFYEAVMEVYDSIKPALDRNPMYRQAKMLERIVEPERVIMFRVPWTDDAGEIHVNRGFRIEMNSAIGPYKGGLRFHPSVNLSILKFLAFEQTLKNALTTLPMGGGKGGSDFDPKGKSDAEVMRFCQSFMIELSRHIGPNTDVPAGDIGVGAREIGYLYGMYKKLRNEFTGALTGKGLNWGGSLVRQEATGFGVVYFLQEMLATRNQTLEGKTVTISGYGNVGTYVVQKVNELGGKVVTIGDEYGYVYDPDGIKGEKWEYMSTLWTVYRESAKEYAKRYGCKWIPNKRPWEVPTDIAIPTAHENEIDGDDARKLVENGCIAVVEGANMPSTPEAIEIYKQHNIIYGPAKAANAGGVAVSGLEMSQNSLRLQWTREEVDQRLHNIMIAIHRQAWETAEAYGVPGDLQVGANIAGFVKVADAMLDQGLV